MGVTTATTGRHIPQVATTIRGPAKRVTTIGTTTSVSQTIPIQAVMAEASSVLRPPAAGRALEASIVATTAAITTTDAAMKAIVSLPSMISS